MHEAEAVKARAELPSRELGTLASTYGAAAFAIACWSVTLIVTKLVVGRVDGVAVGMLRTMLPALVLAPLAVSRGMRFPRGRRARVLLLASTLGGYILFPVLFSEGLRFSAGAHAALILAATPVFTGLFAYLLERRRPKFVWAVGVALAMAGEAWLIAGHQGLTGGALAGDLLVLLACLSAALGYVTGAMVGRDIGSWPTAVWGILLGALLLLPVAPFVLPDSGVLQSGPWAWAGILYLACFASLLAYIAWYWALARGGIARVGALQFLQPVLTLALAVLILGDRLSAQLLLAAVCILGGVFIVQRA
ncbi:MAG TPA: DMT family transporter [Candidatus Cybelea sp.]|nr:DMT family transporter [Candidatus Cybelea sp.]